MLGEVEVRHRSFGTGDQLEITKWLTAASNLPLTDCKEMSVVLRCSGSDWLRFQPVYLKSVTLPQYLYTPTLSGARLYSSDAWWNRHLTALRIVSHMMIAGCRGEFA